jgi:heme a synthase
VDSVLDRVRAREIAPVRFLQLALVSLASLYLVVTTGAVVRLTASGLGCDNWPRCGETPFPEKSGHALIEFSNRMVALTAMALTLVAWLAARRTPLLPRWVTWLSAGAFFGTVSQIPLGGLTVIFDLNPALVMAHFVLALVVLASAAVVAVEAWALVSGRAPPAVQAGGRWAGVVLAAACGVLVVTGTVVTASGPHSGGEDIRRLGIQVVDAVYVHVRATAVFGAAFLVLAWFVWKAHRAAPGLLVALLALLGLLGLQMAVGEIQYRTALPWWLVLIHVALAAAIWAWTVALALALWRPPDPLVRPRT